MKRRRAAIIFFGMVFGLLALTVGVVQSDWFGGRLQAWLLPQLRNQLLADVSIDKVKVKLLSFAPGVVLYGLAVTPNLPGQPGAFSEPPVRVQEVRVVLRTLQLLASRVDVERIELTAPHVELYARAGKLYGLPVPLLNGSAPGGGPSSRKALRLDVIEVRNGTFHFEDDDPKLSLMLTRLDALATIEANGSLVVDVRSEGRHLALQAGEALLDEPLTGLSGELALNGSELEIKGGQVQAGPVHLAVSGLVRTRGPIDVQLGSLEVDAPLDYVRKIAPRSPPITGMASFQGGLSLKGKALRARGHARVPDLRIATFHFGESEADLEVAGTKATARHFRLRKGNGTAEGSGELSWPNGKLALAAQATTHDFSFGQVLEAVGVHDSAGKGSHVDALLDGTLALSGPLDPLEVEAQVDLAHRAFTWRELPFDDPAVVRPNLKVPAGHAAGSFTIRSDGLTFRRVEASAGSSQVVADGTLTFPRKGYPGEADLRFGCTPLDLTGLSPFGPVKVAGTGPATATLHGDLDHLILEGDLALEGTRVADFDFGRAQGDLRFEGLVLSSQKTSFLRGKSLYQGPWKVDFNPPASLAFDAEATDGRIEDLSDIVWSSFPASRYVQGSLSGRLSLSGPFEALSGTFQARASEVTLTDGPRPDGSPGWREGFQSITASGKWDKGTISTEDLVAVKGAGGRLTGRARLEPPDPANPALGGKVEVEVRTANLTLSDLDVLGPEAPLVSEVGLTLKIGGHFFRPEPSGRLYLTDSRLYGVPLGASQVDFEPVPGHPDRMQLVGNVAGGSMQAVATATLSMDARFPYQLQLTATRHPIKPYLHYLNPRLVKDSDLTAFASGQVETEGLLLGNLTRRVEVTINDLQLNKGPHALSNREPIKLAFGEGLFDLKDFSLKGDETDFHLHGRRGAAGTLDFSGGGDVDLVFAELLTDVFTRVEGVVHVERLAIRGRTDDPRVEGVASLERGVFKTRFFPQLGVEEVAGRFHFNQSQITFDSPITGRAGGGSFEGEGKLLLNGIRVREWQLRARVHDASIRFSSQALSARGSGHVEFAGPAADPDHLALTGEMELSEVRYTQPFDWKANAVTFSSRRMLAAPDPSGRLFSVDIVMRAPGSLWVKNSAANMEWRIREDDPLHLVGNNVLWGLTGTIEPVRGKVVFQGRDLTVTGGAITFDDTQTVDCRYEINAETLIRDWTIDVTLRGRFSRGMEDWSAESNPPLTRDDIAFLLILGATQQEARDQDPAAAAGVLASVVGQGVADSQGLTGRVKSLTGIQDLEVVPSYSGVGGGIGLKAVVRQQISPDLTFTGSMGQIGRTTGNVQFDYRPGGGHFHVVAGWNNEQTSLDPNFTPIFDSILGEDSDLSGEAKFHFEWK